MKQLLSDGVDLMQIEDVSLTTVLKIHNALEDSILTGLCFKEMMKIGQNLNLTVDLDDLLNGE